MRISRLQALALAGLLGLAGTGTASAAEKVCPEYLDESCAILLARHNGGFADRQRLAGLYSQELGLSAEAAVRLAGALAAQQTLAEKTAEDDPAFEPEIRRIESEFISLLSQAPDNPRIADEVSWFYYRGLGWWRAPSPALLDLVTRSADPVRLAERLTKHGNSKAIEEILFAALAVDPKPAVLWRRAAQITFDPAWKIAFLEEAWRRVADGETGRPVRTEVAAAMAEELIMEQLGEGLVPQGLAAFQSLPPTVRSLLEQGSESQVKAEVGGLSFEGWLYDLRRRLAAAYLLAGDARAAERWVATIKPTPATRKNGIFNKDRSEELERRVLARWLHPSPKDPFKLLIDVLKDERVSVGIMLPLARLAERERYPAVAAYCLDFLARTRRDESPFEPVPSLPARLRAAAAALQGEIEKLRQGLADEERADREAARTAFGPDPAAATVARSLRAPTAARFAELPLPDGVAPVEPSAEELEERQQAMVAGITLPAGFGEIRVERQGDRAVAIGESQDYDPVGEISTGAYWVLLSSDGGRTWGPPLYTGLRVNQPYVVQAVSRLPLLAGDHLHVEVEIAELDTSKIVFPPVLLTPKRTAKGLYLDIPLELLQKDTDGDGLTDLAEERLMTDPESRDTDGDGLEDGVDPLPNVPFRRAAPSASTRALAAFLADTWNVDRRAIIEGIQAEPRVLCCAKGGPRSVDEKTLFLIADRGLFSALQPLRRVVVLTPEEAAAAQEKFGPFFPQQLELLFLDRSGRRAYVIWNSSWQGGQTLLEEQPDGTWKARATGSWIT